MTDQESFNFLSSQSNDKFFLPLALNPLLAVRWYICWNKRATKLVVWIWKPRPIKGRSLACSLWCCSHSGGNYRLEGSRFCCWLLCSVSATWVVKSRYWFSLLLLVWWLLGGSFQLFIYLDSLLWGALSCLICLLNLVFRRLSLCLLSLSCIVLARLHAKA